MTACWLSFGPDLEPLVGEARRRASAPETRRDGLLVAGTADEVVKALAEAERTDAGWCRLELLDEDGSQTTGYVHAGHVRYVAAVD